MESPPKNNDREPVEGEVFNDAILSRAKELAASFSGSGIDSAPLDVGEATGALIVSSDPEKVLGNTQFVLDGTTYYVGMSMDEIG